MFNSRYQIGAKRMLNGLCFYEVSLWVKTPLSKLVPSMPKISFLSFSTSFKPGAFLWTASLRMF